MQPLWSGNIGNALSENILNRRIATTHGIADNHQIGCRLQMRRIKTLQQLDAGLLQLGAHGGIDIGIAAGNAVTEIFGKLREAAHKGAADAENMYMHGKSS